MSTIQAGDTVVVTGAAHGIGRAIAQKLAGDGVHLALWDIDEEACEESAAACKALGVKTTSWGVDLGDTDRIFETARKTLEAHRVIHGLVNNAGIFPRAAIVDVTPEIWRAVLNVNLLGTVFCTQVFAKAMIQAQRGCIVNIASGRALQGTPKGAHYAASKAGIVSFTKSSALELAPHNIRCNGVIPGVTETAQPLAHTSIEELRARGNKIPLGRIGQPEDVAGIVRFLFSEEAAFMTGQCVVVNGGAQMIP
ncbi:MAG: SDR family oxidoreductase [Marinobacter sp.]|uniref:SDR family NAD(P)-dependent oxidoreductase n=1 Tax=Marinobacter sp. TaxID=50741 RepID=UPI0034A066AE